MAIDKLKKGRNQQPPTSNDDGGESAYGHQNEVTAATELERTKTERLNPVGSGILSDQSREHGASYPGRKLPPVVPVTTTIVQSGVAKKCVATQTGSNRNELNQHAEKKVGK